MMLMRTVGKKVVIRVGWTLLFIANSTTKPLRRPMSASQIDFRKWFERRMEDYRYKFTDLSHDNIL